MPEFHNMLALSTAHLRSETIQMLEGKRPWFHELSKPIFYPKSDYGWFMPISDASEDHTVRAYMPADIVACIDKATELSCSWLMFDMDCDVVPGLKTYDWS